MAPETKLPGCTCKTCPTCHANTVCEKCMQCARCGKHVPGCTGCPAGKTGHMAAKKEKTYLNILDQILDQGFSEAEAGDERERGDELSELTQALAEDGSFTRHVQAARQLGRTHVAQRLGDDNILNDIVVTEREAKSNKDGLQHAANEKAVLNAIDKLLHQGYSPDRIAKVLDKYAELNLWNRQWATDTLNRRVGELGMGYLQPNTFMKQVPDTYERVKPRKLSNVHVAVEADEILSMNESKFGGQARKKARAIEISASESIQPRIVSPQYDRQANVVTRGPADRNKTAALHKRSQEFDAGTVAEKHIAGHSLEKIWTTACKIAGLHAVSKAFHEYVSSARQSGAKFASADVAFLGKIGIKGVPVAKAAPGPLPRVAYDSGKHGGTAKDGNELMKEFELREQEPAELEFTSDYQDVDAGNTEINL